MKRLLAVVLLAFAAHAHDIPDGNTPKEKCENVCEKKHCEDVIGARCYEHPEPEECRKRLDEQRDRCQRACAVSS